MKAVMVFLAVTLALLLTGCGAQQEQLDQAASDDVAEAEAAFDAERQALEAELEETQSELDEVTAERDELAAELEQAASDDVAEEEERQQQEAEEAAGAANAAWVAGLEANIADTMNTYWAGHYENHSITCSDIDIAQLEPGDEFNCDARCDQCDGGATGVPSSISVVYDGDDSCHWQEVLEPGATGPDGGPGAAGSYSGPE